MVGEVYQEEDGAGGKWRREAARSEGHGEG